MTKLIVQICCICCFIITNSFSISASDEYKEYLIYGTVTTEDGESYTGQIRWGKEEAFWFDMFNSTKIKNEWLTYLSKEQIKELDQSKKSNWTNHFLGFNTNSWNDNDHTHSFACHFGEIKKLEINGREKVKLTLKNGKTIRLKGGSNDIGAEVRVVDKETGLIKLKWHRIETVDFMPTPKNIENHFGAPLYGTVITEEGNFTGFVQWDHDERLGLDELNGETEDGDLDIRFEKIKKIEKKFRKSKVTLWNDRKVLLGGSNDVDGDNRGIIVNHPEYGRVDIAWDEFENVTYSKSIPSFDYSYSSFKGDSPITAAIKTLDGSSMKGEIIFDLDEQYQLEMLDGKQDELEYLIPFHRIQEIITQDWDESKIILKSGKELYLEDKVDVNEDNDGVLVKTGTDDYEYVPWKNISAINFY